jgi:hypothetical protein
MLHRAARPASRCATPPPGVPRAVLRCATVPCHAAPQRRRAAPAALGCAAPAALGCAASRRAALRGDGLGVEQRGPQAAVLCEGGR